MTLTPERVQAMSAGPAMDTAIAREVMGWTVPRLLENRKGDRRLQPPNSKEWVAPPNYSKYIAAAYRIVTRLAATHTFYFEVEGNSTWAAFHPVDSRRNVEPDDGAYADGDDERVAALVICKAALVVMANQQEG